MDPNLRRLVAQGDSEDEVSAILRLAKPSMAPSGVRLVAQFGEIATVRLKRGSISDVRTSAEVVSAKAPINLWPDEELEPTEALEVFEEVLPSDVRISSSVNVTGRGVVVGIVDWGLDFAHPEFRHPDGTTRVLALWDQRQPFNPNSPEPYRYGVVYDAKAINQALTSRDPYTTLGYHPADADPDGRGAHGTCVASIAAGNGRSGGPMGVAPEAHIIFVHHSSRDSLGVAKLGDSVTLLEAVDFIARTAGRRPWVINLSMGRHGENHTGETIVEQAFDSLLRAVPGRAICQSTGNYFNRRIHASGLLKPGERRTLIWEVGAFDITPNELEIWYSSRDDLVVEVRSPDGILFRRVGQNESAILGDPEKEIGYIFHRTYEPNTLDNHIKIFLNPGGPLGGWQVTIISVDIVDGRFDAWIERDAACPTCQSHFREEDAVSTTTTGSICNGKRTIAAGAFDSHTSQWPLAPFSSSGPTLTGWYKPDLVAPGVRVLAARSASRGRESNGPLLTRVSGTSFAAPHVTGCVALMFEAAGRPLHIEETHNLLLANCEHVTETKENLYRLGRGYLNIEKTVEAARKANSLAQLVQEAAMNTDENASLKMISDQETSREGINLENISSREEIPSEEIRVLSDQELLDVSENPEIAENPETISDDRDSSIVDREIDDGRNEFAEIYGIESVEDESRLISGEGLEETVSIAPEDWFLTEAEIEAALGRGEGGRRNLAVFTSNNLVRPLVDGEEMMRALRDDVAATRSGDFIHFTAWRMDSDQNLIPSAKPATSGTETVRNLWVNAIRRGVTSRTLFYRAQGGRNATENSRTRDLFLRAGGEAILDARFPSFGSHHQKSAILQRSKEAVSYCGGIDLAGDRWDTRLHNNDPRRVRETWHGWHDVHAKVRGPAVLDIEKNFRGRWNDTSWPTIVPPVRPPVPITTALPPVAASPGTHHVQVLRTYACTSSQYPTFAPRGEFTCLAGYRKAISRATNYIYIEDQYLVFDEIARDLANALRRIQKLIIVVPRDTDGWPQAAFNWHQNNFLNILRASHPGKVQIYDLVQPATGQPIYVHSKVMIIDDIYAVIGSTNFNRRSMTHDTEIAVAVIDATIEDGVCRFARDLRRNLWGEHLNIAESDPRLADPIAAVAEWERQAKAGTYRVRHHTTQTPQDEKKFTWDQGSDPDGRCPTKGQVMIASDQEIIEEDIDLGNGSNHEENPSKDIRGLTDRGLLDASGNSEIVDDLETISDDAYSVGEQPTWAANNPESSPFGILTFEEPEGVPKFSYQFTDEDALWTARFIIADLDGKDDIEIEAVLWAMFNEYALFKHFHHSTFHEFLRNESAALQPYFKDSVVAKRYRYQSDFIKTGGYYPNTSIAKGNLMTYLELQKTPWNQLPLDTRSIAERALKGQVSNPGIGNASLYTSTRDRYYNRTNRLPSKSEWYSFTKKYALENCLKWIGYVPGLDQFNGVAFFIRNPAFQLVDNSVRILPPQSASEESLGSTIETISEDDIAVRGSTKTKVKCPPTGKTMLKPVYGWDRYKRQVEELPPDQQAVLTDIGNTIKISYEPGCQPVQTVQINGHADWDTPRNPQREQQMSEERAQMAADWLKNYVGNKIADKITWDVRGFGATQLKKEPPKTEEDRRQNRRVEIYIKVACINPPVGSNPASLTLYPVGWREYDNKKGIKGSFYYPAESDGKDKPFNKKLAKQGSSMPIVFIAHGNHSPADPSYLGYDYLQHDLAKMGIIAVSVDCNALNGPGGGVKNIEDRADLIIDNIAYFQDLNSDHKSFLFKHIDFKHTGLMGHSRGGDAVVMVPSVIKQTGVAIKAVLALAPTNFRFNAGKPTIRPKDYAFMTILPAGDGDVWPNNGAQFYDRAIPGPFKSQLYVHFANHNFFNRRWLDDDSLWTPPQPAVMARSDHERILAAYGCALFRAILLGHNTAAILAGYQLPSSVLSQNVHLSFELDKVLTVDNFEDGNTINKNSLGQPNSQLAGMSADEYQFGQVSGAFNGSFYGETIGMVVKAGPAGRMFRWSLKGSMDLSNSEIWIRAAEVTDGANVPIGATAFQLGLEDKNGVRTWVDSDDVGGLPRPYPRNPGMIKTMLKTMRFKGVCFSVEEMFEIKNILAILVRFDRTDGRAFAYDDLQIVKSKRS
jgi:phosphatidylserine/phosphatidylglycerophosphate/cardiolipin synthase-like enzyme/subtilisin family serine protease